MEKKKVLVELETLKLYLEYMEQIATKVNMVIASFDLLINDLSQQEAQEAPFNKALFDNMAPELQEVIEGTFFTKAQGKILEKALKGLMVHGEETSITFKGVKLPVEIPAKYYSKGPFIASKKVLHPPPLKFPSVSGSIGMERLGEPPVGSMESASLT